MISTESDRVARVENKNHLSWPAEKMEGRGGETSTYSTQCSDNSIGIGSAIETVIARRNPEPEFDKFHAISSIGVANA